MTQLSFSALMLVQYSLSVNIVYSTCIVSQCRKPFICKIYWLASYYLTFQYLTALHVSLVGPSASLNLSVHIGFLWSIMYNSALVIPYKVLTFMQRSYCEWNAFLSFFLICLCMCVQNVIYQIVTDYLLSRPLQEAVRDKRSENSHINLYLWKYTLFYLVTRAGLESNVKQKDKKKEKTPVCRANDSACKCGICKQTQTVSTRAVVTVFI